MRGLRNLEVWKLGVVNYLDALKQQEKLALERKLHRKCDTLLSLQHPPTYTVGKRQTVHNFLIPQPELEKIGAELHYTQRGGDITFHGPHQAILYPILSLRDMGLGARSFVEKIELTMIELNAMYGVKACPGQSGEPYEFYHCVLKSKSFLEKLTVLEHTVPFFLPIREIENDLLSCNALAVLPTRISVLAWAMFNKNTTATLSWKDDGLSRNHSSPSRLTYAEDALRSISLPEGCVQLGEARTWSANFTTSISADVSSKSSRLELGPFSCLDSFVKVIGRDVKY
ncbi:hypothetical protein Fmac_026629 [Flemingia macrophylla]|uniref:BPL/LPL catalytic domain-containing protein n=1 Tax=Flemingia macrophylla TaxID=520843 RepID=A0ABD1LH48_9FABA